MRGCVAYDSYRGSLPFQAGLRNENQSKGGAARARGCFGNGLLPREESRPCRLADCRTTRLLRNTRRSTHVSCRYCNNPQDAQKGRPHSPSFVKRRSSLVRRKERLARNRAWASPLPAIRHEPYALTPTRYASRFTDVENTAGGLFPHPAGPDYS